MKPILIFILFIITIMPTAAQKETTNKNTAYLGINGGFYGSGDIYMPAFYLEYSHQLNPWLGIAPRILIAHYSKQRMDLFEISTSIAPSISLRINPFPANWRRLTIQIGALYHDLEQSSGWMPKSNSDPPVQYVYNYQHNHDHNYGFLASISYDFLDRSLLRSGVRVDMLTSLDHGYISAESLQMGLYLGFNF